MVINVKEKKRGISLVVLIITLCVVGIIAGTTILILENTDVISKTEQSVDTSNLKQVQDIAHSLWIEGNLNGDDLNTIKNNIISVLGANIASNYIITVTETYVSVSEKGS